MVHRSRGSDKLLDIIVYSWLAASVLFVLFPLFYVVSVSLAPEKEFLTRGFFIIPHDFTLDAYLYLLTNERFLNVFTNSVIITSVGTVISIVTTALMAYGLAKPWLKGRSIINFMVFFTMLFSGGMIPTYLVVKELHLLDTYWALWLPSAIASFNVIVMRGFFGAIPAELEESARMDGCGEWRLFYLIIIPLSMPVVATFTLFYMVSYWNTYFSAILYLNDSKMMPLQVFLRQMLMEDDPNMSQTITVAYNYTPGAEMAAILLTALPLLIVYPFLQKYFNKGVMLGSLKG